MEQTKQVSGHTKGALPFAAEIVSRDLSDGSAVYDVVVTVANQSAVFEMACDGSANSLHRALEDCVNVVMPSPTQATLRAERDALAAALQDVDAQISNALNLGAQGAGYWQDLRVTVRAALAKVQP